MTKEELRAKMDAYLETLDDTGSDEWYTSEKGIHEEGVNGFFNWLYADEIAKEVRRQEYLKLKAEFEGETK